MKRVLLAVLFFVTPAWAQTGLGTLDTLTRPRNGRFVQYSSWDRSGGNADFRAIAPGETFTLLDHRGAGTVRRWWLTVAPRNNQAIQRQLIVRCYWDGETDPSVEVPLSDFFGVGFGEWHDFVSLPLNMTSGGYNCYWPMPFRNRARITVENRSKVRIDAFYYNISVETQPSLSPDTLLFHAQFRRTNPTQRGQSVPILQTTGRGHYVGTLLSMQSLRGRGLGFLEGDEQVYVDGERTPSVIGTGTEDYFSSGWYYDTGVYSAPYHGVTIKDTVNNRVSTYRWHIEDPIPFTRSLDFFIEHGAVNDATADYTSVAFWYQTHPHAKFPPLPADLMPAHVPPLPRISGLIEGESLLETARAANPNADVRVQGMEVWEGLWSGYEQLWWQPKGTGETLNLTLTAPATVERELIGYFTRADDYGDFRLTLNGRQLSPEVSAYARAVTPSGAISFGRVLLKAGNNQLTLEITGKNALSRGYFVGIDGFLFK